MKHEHEAAGRQPACSCPHNPSKRVLTTQAKLTHVWFHAWGGVEVLVHARGNKAATYPIRLLASDGSLQVGSRAGMAQTRVSDEVNQREIKGAAYPCNCVEGLHAHLPEFVQPCSMVFPSSHASARVSPFVQVSVFCPILAPEAPYSNAQSAALPLSCRSRSLQFLKGKCSM